MGIPESKLRHAGTLAEGEGRTRDRGAREMGRGTGVCMPRGKRVNGQVERRGGRRGGKRENQADKRPMGTGETGGGGEKKRRATEVKVEREEGNG